MNFVKLQAAFIAAIFFLSPVVSLAAQDYSFAQQIQLTVEGGRLTEQHRATIRQLIEDTVKSLDPSEPDSLLNQLNNQTLQPVPDWLFTAISRCESWHTRSEGKFSCRNGRLKQYWYDYVRGQGKLERREARKLARSARTAEVTLEADSSSVKVAAPISWDFSDLQQAILFERIVDYLTAQQIATFHLQQQGLHAYIGTEYLWQHSRTEATDRPPLTLRNIVSYELSPWAQSIVPGSAESGMLSHNDGWPAALHASHTLADNALDAVVIGYLAATVPSRYLLPLLDTQAQHVALMDVEGRIYQSAQYPALAYATAEQQQQYQISIALPYFNVANYRGPYVTVWITDTNHQLIKNLLIRGTAESWLRELRVWWRKVGRNAPELIDGMSGATERDRPIAITWDGLDQYGQSVKGDAFWLHIEAAREHGDRSYHKIPFTLSALATETIHIPAAGELGSISMALSAYR